MAFGLTAKILSRPALVYASTVMPIAVEKISADDCPSHLANAGSWQLHWQRRRCRPHTEHNSTEQYRLCACPGRAWRSRQSRRFLICLTMPAFLLLNLNYGNSFG